MDQPEDTAVRIYPNPTSDFISINNNTVTNFDVSVYDLTGRIIHAEQNVPELQTKSFTPPSTGLYFIYAETISGKTIFCETILKF